MFALAFLLAFAFAAGLVVASVVLQRLTGLPAILVLIVGSALWAAWDSSKLGFSRYKGGNNPVTLFLGIMALWLVGLPWYLAKRFQLKRGGIPLKKPHAVGEPSPS